MEQAPAVDAPEARGPAAAVVAGHLVATAVVFGPLVFAVAMAGDLPRFVEGPIAGLRLLGLLAMVLCAAGLLGTAVVESLRPLEGRRRWNWNHAFAVLPVGALLLTVILRVYFPNRGGEILFTTLFAQLPGAFLSMWFLSAPRYRAERERARARASAATTPPPEA